MTDVEKIVNLPVTVDLAEHYGMPAQSFLATVKSVAMPSSITTGQMIACLAVAREHGLNPLTKEIYFMPTKSGQIQPVVSVDGWIRKMNEHDQFDGLEFETAGEGDSLEMTCRVYRKDRSRPVSVTEYLSECKQGGPVWKTHPRRMLRNRTLCQAARIAFGFAGIMEPDEFQQWQDNPELAEVVDITPSDPRDGGSITFKGEAIKRPSRQGAIDAGLQEQHAALLAQIEGEIDTLDDLHNCYDAFCEQGAPWAKFPKAWADMLQMAYHYRLHDLDTDGVSDDGAFQRAIEAAQSIEMLQQLWEEASEADREAHEQVYLDQLDKVA